MTFQLYATLELGIDASQEAIKAAYRRLVKTHHPDAGGDPEAFRAIQEAYDVLSDPERRQRYDETGETSTPIDSTDGDAIEVLNAQFTTLLNDNDLKYKDVVTVMRANIRKERADVEKHIADAAIHEGRLVGIRDRFGTRKKLDRDIVRGLIEQRLGMIKYAVEAGHRHIKVLDRALVLLEDYTFTPEPPAAPPPWANLPLPTDEHAPLYGSYGLGGF